MGLRNRTLTVTASATLVALAAFTTAPATMSRTVASLGGGTAGLTWGLSAMGLGLAAALLPLGALADNLGRRQVLAWSTGTLAATSALAALAPTIAFFIGARILQGIAGAGVIASSLGIIGHAFPSGHARTHATGVWSAALGGGIAIGPLATCALVDATGWRSGYWLQAAAAAMVVPAAASLAESRAGSRRPIALREVATLGVGMAALTAGLVQGRSDWTSAATIALLSGGALLLAAFAGLELRRRAPMVDPRLLRDPLFLASVTGALFTGVAVVGLMSYAQTLMQRGLGIGLLASAAVIAAWSATSMVVALGARRLPARLTSQARLAIGLALAAAGELALTGLGTGSAATRLLPGLLVAGVGSGVANAALGRLAVESVPHGQASMGSGANNTARYLGGAAGVAVVVAVIGAASSGTARPRSSTAGTRRRSSAPACAQQGR